MKRDIKVILAILWLLVAVFGTFAFIAACVVGDLNTIRITAILIPVAVIHTIAFEIDKA